MEVINNKITLSLRSKIAVRRAKRQLFDLPITLLRDELNLTRSMLRPIHTFHKLAARHIYTPGIGVVIYLNPDQHRILKWRINSGGIAGVIGPPGFGKTTFGALQAIKLVSEGYANRVLLVALTNSAPNEFSRELSIVLGRDASKFMCVRSGYAPGADNSLPISFSNELDVIKKK